jgi:cysteine desulfurase/selenocysteine lyase
MQTWGVSAVAFSGHKALLGPSGIGGLVVAADLEVQSTRFGGTGLESQSLRHTQSYPQRLEAGSTNLLGIIGLSLGLDYLLRLGLKESHDREMALIRRLREGLACTPGVTVLSPVPRDGDLPVLTCTVQGIDPEDVGAILDGDYGIAVRTGLLRALCAHRPGSGGHGLSALQPGARHQRRRHR